jgi:DNA invertase Pin-like site-specific DNA recombinase
MSEHHPTPLAAVAYYRKSNEDGGDSIDQQRTWAAETAAREAITIQAEFADQARTGHETARRTDFHAMLRYCQQRHKDGRPIDCILCWHADRFSRADSQETSWYVWELRKAGVGRMLTASRWIDFARMEDRVLFNIEQDTSNHPYVINLARAATRGRISAAKEGRWNGGQVPYAYRVEYEIVSVRGKKKRRPVRLVKGPEAEVEVVRWMFHSNRIGVMVEVRCATDFVANTDEFRTLCKELCLQIAGVGEDNLLEQPYVRDGKRTVKDVIEETQQKVAEPITVKRTVRWELGDVKFKVVGTAD